ncbi:efflux RND transporter periplasmic adaptor subunit [Pseudoalteromonas ruthenica]|uniref:efflux RND transporter periplasmic adaptor subunit n=1 Tax=Pseudoalteromonas ruthenica TaxID=151081 RepID=UPI00241E137F|nr:efflux RND transporter periplasmic adaptor subunit [Pseudoalteromonas ruthenica]|tara:strand:+ start:31853 stop:33310 length:1458 start_codon:yes stop_codon:yes gene_type:complete
MKQLVKYALAMGIAAAVTWGVTQVSHDGAPASSTEEQQSAEKKPLYWVAPMDSSYRRDGPGKSPMGMDLVPVYDEPEDEPGVIAISASVENNLGVRSAQVSKRQLVNSITSFGNIRYDEEAMVHVHPRVAGWVEQLYVKSAGAKVSQGQPLYTLYSPDLVNAQKEFILALNSQDEVLRSAAVARLKAFKIAPSFIEELTETHKVQQNITYYARQDGVIEQLNVREGFYVKPENSLMDIAATDQVWVIVDVHERQLPYLNEGAEAVMTLDYLPQMRWRGSVEYVYPSLDTTTRTAQVRLRFANPNGALKANMFAKVVIDASNNAPTLSVPQQAVINTAQGQRVVLALGDGRFKSVAVHTGRVADSWVEILAGLEPGQKIVTSGQFLLDSESNKQAELARLDKRDYAHARVNGEVKAINHAERTVRIARGPIEKWNREATTMDFKLDAGLATDFLSEGMQIRFRFEIRAGQFVVTDIEILSEQEGAS